MIPLCDSNHRMRWTVFPSGLIFGQWEIYLCKCFSAVSHLQRKLWDLWLTHQGLPVHIYHRGCTDTPSGWGPPTLAWPAAARAAARPAASLKKGTLQAGRQSSQPHCPWLQPVTCQIIIWTVVDIFPSHCTRPSFVCKLRSYEVAPSVHFQ